MVLATVYATEGSTYSKAGAQMLISPDGLFQGMLSGGCLEGDLAERAAAVFASGSPQAVTYDLGQNDEELWGLGVGCDGLMRIFLQPLESGNNYEPFTSMNRAYEGAREESALTVIASEHPELSAGAGIVSSDGSTSWTNISSELAGHLSLEECQEGFQSISLQNQKVEFLLSTLHPPPSILVLGAGLDAEPVVRLADELGWRVVIADHRPAYISAGNFEKAEHVVCHPATETFSELDASRFSACIVMSHHLATDRIYLRQIAETDIPYVGLLGPANRRDRLIAELGDCAMRLQGRLFGPAGLDLGARGPAPIALSIIAEMQRFLMQEKID